MRDFCGGLVVGEFGDNGLLTIESDSTLLFLGGRPLLFLDVESL